MTGTAAAQIAAIAEMTALAEDVGVQVWLRGGWAMDFLLGRITRTHADIDWFVLEAGAPALRDSLLAAGFVDMTTADPAQQIDLVRGPIEHGIAIVRLGGHGEPLVAGGPWAGQPWPEDMLHGPTGRIGTVAARLITAEAQIEIKQMTPTWNPSLPRRQQDLDDIRCYDARRPTRAARLVGRRLGATVPLAVPPPVQGGARVTMAGRDVAGRVRLVDTWGRRPGSTYA